MSGDKSIAGSSGEHNSKQPGQLDLAVVIPTYNERENVPGIVKRLDNVLGHLRYEIIFVDDNSPDGTSDVVRDQSLYHARVRCVTRVGRRGLSSAAIEGMMATTAPVVAVIDGDMQHDEAQLPAMLEKLNIENLDVVVGSRYAEGGGFGEWSDRRRRMSELATTMAKRLTGVDLTDPMSGFFMARSDRIREKVADLTGVGYKILLDLLSAPGKQLTVGEVPYEFRTRELGESKLDSKVILEFAELLIARTVGRWVPTKFIMFSIVGASGVVVHMLILTYLFRGGYSSFFVAQATATVVAMTTNFLVNNFFTYYDRQLRGWKLIPGWLSFCAASSVGAVANLGVAVYMFETAHVIWFGSALAGVIVGSAWNYAVTALLTWKS